MSENEKNEGGLDNICEKITVGYVTQTLGFNKDGRLSCTNQEFIAGDEVSYENEFGEIIIIDPKKVDYQPFEMVQPNTEIVVTVEGGVIQNIAFPSGMNDVTVVVKDYDIDGDDENLQKDGDGDEYSESRWTP